MKALEFGKIIKKIIVYGMKSFIVLLGYFLLSGLIFYIQNDNMPRFSFNPNIQKIVAKDFDQKNYDIEIKTVILSNSKRVLIVTANPKDYNNSGNELPSISIYTFGSTLFDRFYQLVTPYYKNIIFIPKIFDEIGHVSSYISDTKVFAM